MIDCGSGLNVPLADRAEEGYDILEIERRHAAALLNEVDLPLKDGRRIAVKTDAETGWIRRGW